MICKIYTYSNQISRIEFNLISPFDKINADKMQELNTDFSKICISPKLSGVPMGKVPLPVLKELEHQARQNLSTINLTAAFA